ncbi:MAG: FAD-dependent oxidoreductase [Blastocatellia bacterium]
MFTFHDINGRQVIRGVAGELVDRLVALTVSKGHVADLTFDNASMTPFDPEGMKIALFEMVQEAVVKLLLHTWVVDAIGNGERVESVIIENKSGRQAIRPKLVIDCSADTDIVARVGAPFVKGRESDGAMQPVTLFFRIAGVDVPRLKNWMKQNRELLKDAPTAEDLTRAEILTRKQAWQIHKFLQRRVGGFEDSYVLDTGVQVGVRETRHIIGDYTLTEDDVLTSRAFPDGVADEVADPKLVLHRAGGSGATASHFNPYQPRVTGNAADSKT